MPSKSKENNRQRTIPSDAAAIAPQAGDFLRICYKWADTRATEDAMRSITLYPPAASRNGMWLAVAKAGIGSGRLVTFYRATDPLTALAGIMRKIEQGKAEWKKDEWGT